MSDSSTSARYPDSLVATSLTGRLALWAIRHRRQVLMGWILVAIAGVAACVGVAVNTASDLKGTGESARGDQLIAERLGRDDDPVNEFIVLRHPNLIIDDDEYRAVVDELVIAVNELLAKDGQPYVAATLSHFDIGASRTDSPLVASDAGGGDITFIQVTLAEGLDDAVEGVGQLLNTVDAVAERHPSFEIATGGQASLLDGLDQLLADDFTRASLFSLPVTFVILILALGTITAAAVPIVLGFSAVGISLGILTLLSQTGFALQDAYAQAVLLVGLSAAIDYSIYLVIRYRQERRQGMPEMAAIIGASATAGKAISIAAITTILALSGMFLLDEPLFSSIAAAAIVSVAVSLVMALTLTPAWLATVGDGINRFGVPGLQSGFAVADRGGFLARWIDWMLQRPLLYAPIAVVALIAISSPLFGINLGVNGLRGFPSNAQGVGALNQLEDSFSLGLVQPVEVVIDAGEGGDVLAAETQAGIAAFRERVASETASTANPDGVFAEPIVVRLSEAGNLMVLEVPVNAAAGDPLAVETVARLRDDFVAKAFDGRSATALVTGETARNVDFIDKMESRLPLMIAYVLITSFVVLVIMFRSLLLPLAAILLNLLAVGAAFGILKLAFQDGAALEGLLGFEATGVIEAWVPLFVFAIIFGVSFDDLMLALGRIKEFHDRGADVDTAIRGGVKSVAMTIVAVDLILAGVVAIFAFASLVFMKQLGTAMFVAVVLGAALVVAIVMPALLRAIGDRLWYFPSWLRWVPKVSTDDAALREAFPLDSDPRSG